MFLDIPRHRVSYLVHYLSHLILQLHIVPFAITSTRLLADVFDECQTIGSVLLVSVVADIDRHVDLQRCLNRVNAIFHVKIVLKHCRSVDDF